VESDPIGEPTRAGDGVDLGWQGGMSAAVIRKATFDVARRGFDQRQVRAYLERVASWVEGLIERINDLESGRETMPERNARDHPGTDGPSSDAAYERAGRRAAELIGLFEEQVERLRHEDQVAVDRAAVEARADAGRVRHDADEVLREARAEGERVVEAAQAEAEQALARLRSNETSVVQALTEMQGELREAVSRLDAMLDADGRDHGVVIVRDVSETQR